MASFPIKISCHNFKSMHNRDRERESENKRKEKIKFIELAEGWHESEYFRTYAITLKGRFFSLSVVCYHFWWNFRAYI